MKTSVALCTYNGAKYLRQQLESIADQTHPVDEIVICDDRSSDGTCDIVERFARRFSRQKVRLIRNEVNIGFLRNFEQAMTSCEGDIIFLSDQDDIWMKDKVETVLNYFQEHPEVAFAFSDARLINSAGTAFYDQTLFDVVGLDKKNKRLFRQGFALDLLSTSGRVTGCTSAVRASFLPHILPFRKLNVKPIHDEVMAVVAASHDRIGMIDKCLISYRQHPDQTVGISLLFKFPPRHQELAEKLRAWDMEMIDPAATRRIAKQKFVEDRFWTLRSPLGWAKCFVFLLEGKYHRYYPYPLIAFKEDILGFFRRRLAGLSDLPKRKLSFVYRHGWNI